MPLGETPPYWGLPRVPPLLQPAQQNPTVQPCILSCNGRAANMLFCSQVCSALLHRCCMHSIRQVLVSGVSMVYLKHSNSLLRPAESGAGVSGVSEGLILWCCVVGVERLVVFAYT